MMLATVQLGIRKNLMTEFLSGSRNQGVFGPVIGLPQLGQYAVF